MSIHTQPRLTDAQMRCLRALADAPLLPYIRGPKGRLLRDAASLPVLQRLGLIEPREPLGTGWRVTATGRAVLNLPPLPKGTP